MTVTIPKFLRIAYRRRIFHAYLFIAPVILLFGIFRIVPSVQTLAYSFFKVELIRKRFIFVGLENFRALLQDEIFIKAMGNTLIYVVSIVPISAGIALLLAVLFNGPLRFKEIFKALYFSPMVTSTVAAAMVWWWMYNPQYGIFNVLLKLVGIPAQPWLMSSRQALGCIVAFSVWKILGYNMVIYLAGLQAIPKEIEDAAEIDGAGAVKRFFLITVPLIAPTTTFILLYNTILAFQVFDQVFVLTSGGPANASTVVVLELYKQAFQRYNFGYAAAQAMVLFLCILIVTIFQFFYTRRSEVTY